MVLRQLLFKNFKCVVVYEFINIKEAERIKWIVHSQWTINESCSTVCRHEMCSPINGINMDNCKKTGTVALNVGLNHPHSSIFVTFVANERVPLDESTWVYGILVDKGKKKENSTDVQSVKRIILWAVANEGTVVTWGTIPPRRCCTNLFTPHAPNAAGIARCTKCSWRRIKYSNFSVILD